MYPDEETRFVQRRTLVASRVEEEAFEQPTGPKMIDDWYSVIKKPSEKDRTARPADSRSTDDSCGMRGIIAAVRRAQDFGSELRVTTFRPV